jgi:DNA primase catalytic subunit
MADRGLSYFWTNLFPWDSLLSFLTFNRRYKLIHCEFAIEKGTFYQRNLSFVTEEAAKKYCTARQIPYFTDRQDGRYRIPLLFFSVEEFRSFMLEKIPSAIHVGSIYLDGQHGRKWERDSELTIRPFVLDLDIDESDRSKTVSCDCKLERRCCKVCWEQWLVPRAESIVQTLRLKLELRRIVLVYSGRRGLHVWVMDDRACQWTSTQRLNALTLIEWSGNNLVLDREVTLNRFHLCKCPLVPHKVTGRIAVTIPYEQLATFDPGQVPTVNTVTREQMETYCKNFNEC